MKHTRAKLEHNFSVAEAGKTELKQQVVKLEAALAESNSLLVKLSEELAALRAQINTSTVEADLKRALDASKAEAARLAEDSASLKILKKEQQDKDQELAILKSKLEALESKLETKCDEVLDLKDQYKEITQTVDSY